MKKELRDRVEKAIGALAAEVTKNPAIEREAVALVRDLLADLRVTAKEAYTAGVTARKAEREDLRAAKAAARLEAQTAKEEAKAKMAAALAIKVNGRVAKKRATAAVQEEIVETVEPATETPAMEEEALPEIF